MADESGEKTEDATPKRRKDARKKGDVPQSRDITSVVGLIAIFGIGISALAVDLAASLVAQSRSAWGGGILVPTSLDDYATVLGAHGAETARALLPVLALMMLAGAAGPLLQNGWLWSPEKLRPKTDMLNPIKGLKRLVSLEKVFDLLKAFVKIGVSVTAVWLVIGSALPTLLSLANARLAPALTLAALLIRQITLWIIVGFGLFAIFDLVFTRWRYSKKLRMSKQEVRDEVKQREGDPKIKAKIRSMAQELSRHRMIASVGTADVVVTNPTHFAVALQYNREEMAAPKVVAKGRNHLALRIRAEARERGVPIVENPPLAQLLYKTAPLGREIPEALFQAVAEVLAYISRLDPRRSQAWRAAS